VPVREVPPAPREDRAVAVDLGPAPEPVAQEAEREPDLEPVGIGPEPVAPVPVAPPPAGPESDDEDQDQADAGEVRRQIAVASRSFDPDHQIRRAMDAFLSPVGDAERRTPDH
jgi:hypothetical protein